MILTDSNGNQLPDLPYEKVEGMRSDLVRIHYFNFMIHISTAKENDWKFTYMPDKKAAWIEPNAKAKKSPYFAFHPVNPPYHG